MKKSIAGLLAAFSAILIMAGCTGSGYKIEFDDSGFESKKMKYAEGETVTITYPFMATDTNYNFYLDCEDVELKQEYDYQKGMVLTFVMPAHDVKIFEDHYNSMEIDPNANMQTDIEPEEEIEEETAEPDVSSNTEAEEKEEKPILVYLGDNYRIFSDSTYANISGIDVSELDIEEFFASLPKLEKIIMKDCGLDNDGYAALQDAHPDIRIVWDIKTKYYTIPTDSVGFSTLIGMNDPRRLYNEDMKYFKYCTDMVALDIGHNHISDLSFLEYMPELRVLILVENYPLDGSSRRLKDISALKYCKKLRYLEFFANDVNDMSVLSELTELEDLNICYNPVTSADAIKDLPNLQKLWIYGTRIPKDDLRELRQIYPDTRIVTSGSGSVDQGWRSGAHYKAMRNMVINNVIDEEYMNEELEIDEEEPSSNVDGNGNPEENPNSGEPTENQDPGNPAENTDSGNPDV
ncbi:MAG: hypothetical protein K5776_00075 [Lachnospiraceae bacterium]|nr:hypothetical protein [Lachnospiraceae bacterium]